MSEREAVVRVLSKYFLNKRALHECATALSLAISAAPSPVAEGEGSSNASRAAMGPLPHVATDVEPSAFDEPLIERLAYEASVWTKDPAHNIGADQPSLVFARRFAFLLNQATGRQTP